ncbi:MAG: 16S rRNA (guanine(966)-N(2))-methyltransferase RsmD [Sorangiineae bacterium NIC37A_2]|jgi:16S rRNA (guanine966-N2)-methyltransferase|nr:MAG: 16S rRNA (guanine(966)-N(2))-methyltransferase RsmD [Sorangiineae bacterium NIC37A_2]
MRIIAGEFRGRRLVAPSGPATRPTTDRVREAWFSMIGRPGRLAVDLYAGTGALGFEALSRGAERVLFVERRRPALIAIRKNAEALGVSDRIRILSVDVGDARAALLRESPFDLVLADPPWTDFDAAQAALRRLVRADLLTEEGLAVLGHPRKSTLELPPESGLVVRKTRAWGDSAATFYERKPEVETTSES